MPSYTVKSFQKDLKQLGGMIENFYVQEGGAKHKSVSKKKKSKSVKKKSKSVKKKSKSQKGGAKKSHRNFKIISVNDKPYKYPNNYKGAEPKNAAKKVGRFVCEKIGFAKKNKSCKFSFMLKETTRGSNKRTYGPYQGFFEKRNKPKVFQFRGMKKKEVSTHEFKVKLKK